MSAHQYAEAGFLHLGRFITQTYNAVDVKALRTISEAAYPLLALSLKCNQTNVCSLHGTASFRHIPSAEMKRFSKSCRTSPTPVSPLYTVETLHSCACDEGGGVHPAGLMKSSLASEQDKSRRGLASRGSMLAPAPNPNHLSPN